MNPTLAGRYKRDAQGNYSPWLRDDKYEMHPASTAYAAYLTKVAGGGYASKAFNKNPEHKISESDFFRKHRDSGGAYKGPSAVMGQLTNVAGQQSTFSQQPQNKQNPQMQGYIQQIQQQIQQLQQQLKQMQQGY